MNSRKSLYDVNSYYNKKAVLKASYEGMRYQIQEVERKEEKRLLVTVWPEPFGFDKTPDEKKEQQDFSYDEEGLDTAYEWLCRIYEEQAERWEHARDVPMDGILF